MNNLLVIFFVIQFIYTRNILAFNISDGELSVETST